MARNATTRTRDRASDASPQRAATSELAPQIAALQDAMTDVRKTLDTQFQRIAAMQVELDQLTTKREG